MSTNNIGLESILEETLKKTYNIINESNLKKVSHDKLGIKDIKLYFIPWEKENEEISVSVYTLDDNKKLKKIEKEEINKDTLDRIVERIRIISDKSSFGDLITPISEYNPDNKLLEVYMIPQSYKAYDPKDISPGVLSYRLLHEWTHGLFKQVFPYRFHYIEGIEINIEIDSERMNLILSDGEVFAELFAGLLALLYGKKKCGNINNCEEMSEYNSLLNYRISKLKDKISEYLSSNMDNRAKREYLKVLENWAAYVLGLKIAELIYKKYRDNSFEIIFDRLLKEKESYEKDYKKDIKNIIDEEILNEAKKYVANLIINLARR